MWDSVLVKALEVLACIGAILVAIWLHEATKYLREQAEHIECRQARELLMSAIAEAEIVGADAVRATNQMFVDSLRQSSTDGKISREDAATAMKMAVDYFKNHLSSAAVRILSAPAELADQWVQEFLEAKLAQIKACAQ